MSHPAARGLASILVAFTSAPDFAAGCGEYELATPFRRARLARELHALPSLAELTEWREREERQTGAARLFEARGPTWMKADRVRARRDGILMELSFFGATDIGAADLAYPAFASLLGEQRRLAHILANLERLEREPGPPRGFEHLAGRRRIHEIAEALSVVFESLRRCRGYWIEMNARANRELSNHPLTARMEAARADLHARVARLRSSLRRGERRRLAERLHDLEYDSSRERFPVSASGWITPLVRGEARAELSDLRATFDRLVAADEARVRHSRAAVRRRDFRIINRE